MRTSTGANLVSWWVISRSAAKTCIDQNPKGKRYPAYAADNRRLPPPFVEIYLRYHKNTFTPGIRKQPAKPGNCSLPNVATIHNEFLTRQLQNQSYIHPSGNLARFPSNHTVILPISYSNDSPPIQLLSPIGVVSHQEEFLCRFV